MHDENCDHSLRLNRLAIRSIRSRIDNDLSLLYSCHHWLLHRHHVSWLLQTWLSHVHLCHSSWIALAIHQHLLLGSSLLIELALALVIVSLRSWFTIYNSWLTKGTSHLAGHSNLRNKALIHLWSLVRVAWHRKLLLIHERLLVLMGFILIHPTSLTMMVLTGHWLTQLMHAMSIRAIIAVMACLACIKMLAHHCLVIFEVPLAAILVLALMALSRASISLIATSSSTASTTRTRKAIIIGRVHAPTHASTTLGSHTPSAAASAPHLVIAWATPWGPSIVLAIIGLVPVVTMGVVTLVSASAITPSLVVRVSAAPSPTVIASPAVVTFATAPVVDIATWAGPRAAPLTSSIALPIVSLTIAHAPVLSHDATTCLSLHVLRDRVIDVPQLTISVSILAILIPLAISFVLKMATFLCLESLIDLAIFNTTLSVVSILLLLLLLLLLRLRHWLLHHLLLRLTHLLLHVLLLTLWLLRWVHLGLVVHVHWLGLLRTARNNAHGLLLSWLL